MGRAFTRLALGLLTACLAGRTAHAEVTVFKNFALVDSVAGRAKPASAMIVDNGKITWVGPARQLKVPKALR